MMPRRWLVVGSSGSGKSTLSRRLATVLDLPLIHLDLHYWRAGWVPTPKSEWQEKVRDLVRGDEWVIDGNYSGTIADRLPRAEAVVLLDLPPWRCAGRVVKRYLSPQGRSDIPEDCPDRIHDAALFWWILTYRWRSLPKVLRRTRQHPHVVLTRLRSDAEVERFVEELTGRR